MNSVKFGPVTQDQFLMRELNQMARGACAANRLSSSRSKLRAPNAEPRVSAGVGVAAQETENRFYLDALETMAAVGAGIAQQPRIASTHPINAKGLKGFVLRSAHSAKVSGRTLVDGACSLATSFAFGAVRVARGGAFLAQAALAGAVQLVAGATRSAGQSAMGCVLGAAVRLESWLQSSPASTSERTTKEMPQVPEVGGHEPEITLQDLAYAEYMRSRPGID